MSAFSSVTSNLADAAAGAAAGAARIARSGANQPLKAARVLGRMVGRIAQKPGGAPGVLIHTGPRFAEDVRLRVIEYDAEKLREVELTDIQQAFPLRDNPPVGWLNVDGLHEATVLENLRDHFGLHLLLMEDVVTVGQRPKMEEFDGCILFVLPMLSFDEKTQSVESEQLTLVLGPSWVLTFQERVGDVFEPVRERLRNAHGRIRTRGSDYLAYALMDAVVDRYFGILERLGDVAEDLDERIILDPTPRSLQRVNHLKRELLIMRKSVWPLREALSAFARTESPLVSDSTQVFVRDVYDNAVHVIDTVETLRDLAGGMTDLYLSSVGQKTNEVMKVLTVMASIFIPLTFMAGVYGMNFEFMPELSIPWAYPALWVLMLMVAGGMLWFFRRKQWL